MEQNKEIMQMLDLMVCPAFCVKDGAVLAVNAAAAQQLLTVGTPVTDILVTGQQEYSEFEGGCLYLTVNIANARCGASVKRVGDLDIFVTEHDTAQAELQALALAARELRTPLANTMSSADSLFSMPLLSESEEAAEYAAFINRSIYRMHRIILNMSDAYLYTQNEAANMEIRDISSLLEEQFRQSAEVFAGVKTVASGITKRTCFFVGDWRLAIGYRHGAAVGLCVIFDKLQAIFLAQIQNMLCAS